MGRVHTILVVRSDRQVPSADSDLLEAATAEILRTSIFAADAVLVPASAQVLPMAAVVARGVFREQRDEGGDSYGTTPIPSLPGRFIPFRAGAEETTVSLAPFLGAYLGGSALDLDATAGVEPLGRLLVHRPVDLVVALTPDAVVANVLREQASQPRVCYFKSLPGAEVITVQFGPVAASVVDLAANFTDGAELDIDPESGRSDDVGLEPLIPFGLLLQAALWLD